MIIIGAVVTLVATIWGLVLGIQGLAASQDGSTPDQQAEARDQAEKNEEDAREAGPPIDAVAGGSTYLNIRYAFPERTLELGEGAYTAYMGEEYQKWFKKNRGLEVAVGVVRVTLFPMHKGTVVIQNMRLTNLKCEPTKYAGTAIVPPPIGDGGEGVMPVDIAFDLTEPVPRPRINAGFSESARGVEVWQIKGNAFSKGIYLDGGEQSDARSIDLYFFTGKMDCNFGVEVNVTSKGKDDWYPIMLGDGFTYKVAGQADRYESVIGPSESSYGLQGPGNPFKPIYLEKSRF